MKNELTAEIVIKGLQIGEFKLKPVTFSSLDKDGNRCGCLVTAAYCYYNNCKLEFENGNTFSNTISAWADEFYGISYAAGIENGFDNHKPNENCLNDNSYNCGYKRGQELRILL